MKSFTSTLACLVALLALHPGANGGVLQERQGLWLGELKTPDGRTLRLGAELLTRADGSLWASFASPDQDAYDIPVKGVAETEQGVELDLSFATMKMTWDKDHFIGEFTQNGVPQPLVLKQVQQLPVRARPQTPAAPFPYRDETLAIAGADGVVLGATLSLPAGVARPNVVVLVHGSGPGNRDAQIAGHRGFAVIADYLARRGIAVLRYDKRGVARSTGDYAGHVQTQLADDLGAVVRALKKREQFKRVGLVGVSEGPAIAAAVSARDPEAVDFVVSLAGTGLTGLDMILLQDRVYAQGNKAGPKDLARLMLYARKWYGIIVAEADAGARVAKLKAMRAALSPHDKALVEKFKMNVGTLTLEWAGQPSLRASLLADPRKDWRAVHVPVLALNGGLDRQVPARENLGGIVGALKAGGNEQVESAILPSLNHLFQTANTGAEDEYARIEETISPLVLQKIAAFIKKQP
ncbi:MAG: alpha/beta fold hydrolase [Pseudomonadota bacterium]